MKIDDNELGQLPLFSGLTPKEFQVLRENLVLREFKLGEVLFDEGDPARSCFVILNGRVGVYIRNKEGEQEEIAQLICLSGRTCLNKLLYSFWKFQIT